MMLNNCSKGKIGIITAMKVEAEELISLMAEHKTETVSGMVFHDGVIRGKECIVVVGGVGKVFAAICAEVMILKYSPSVIINSGVAGTLTGKLSVGDVVVASELVQHDMDTSAVGDPIGMVSGINIVNFPCDSEVSGLLACCASKVTNCVRGIIASGDQFVTDMTRKKWIKDTFGAVACEMEGAAIAHACYINNTPCAVMRAISDGDTGEVSMDYPTFVKMAAERAVKVVVDFLERYGKTN